MTLRVWDGISVYRTQLQATRKARDYPFLGRFIAELDLDVDLPRIRAEKTFGRGHYTIWGPAAALLHAVVAVIPLPDVPTGDQATRGPNKNEGA